MRKLDVMLTPFKSRSCVLLPGYGVRKEGRAGRWQGSIRVCESRIRVILGFE